MQNLDEYRVKNFGLNIFQNYIKKQERILKGQIPQEVYNSGYKEKNCPDCQKIRDKRIEEEERRRYEEGEDS